MRYICTSYNRLIFFFKHRQKLTRKKCIHYVSVIMMVIVVLFFLSILKAYFEGRFYSVESFQNYISKYGVWGPVFLIIFQGLQVVIPVLPGFLGCAVGSVMYGPCIGFLCNYIGISSGSILAFFLGKRFGAPLLQDLFPSEKYKKWSRKIAKSKSYITFLFFAMLLPLFPDDFLCYFSGITEMKAKKFIWIIILGKPWCIFAYSLGFSIIT